MAPTTTMVVALGAALASWAGGPPWARVAVGVAEAARATGDELEATILVSCKSVCERVDSPAAALSGASKGRCQLGLCLEWGAYFEQ